ncbi:MAG: ABC transporter permease [Nitrososphaerota archaeon]
MRELPVLVMMLFKNWLRSRTGVFFSFLFPVILLLIFGTVFGGQQQVSYTIEVQNLDRQSDGEPTTLSKTFIDLLNQTVFRVKELDPGINPREYMTRDVGFKSRRVLIIPNKFEESLIRVSMVVRFQVCFETMKLILERFGQYMSESQRRYLEQGISQIEKANISQTIKPVQLVLLTSPADQAAPTIREIIDNIAAKFGERSIGATPIISLNQETVEVRRLSAVDYYLPGYIAAFITANGMIGVTSYISEFRRSGVLKRLVATPLSKLTWILGNILVQAVLAIILMIIMMVLGWAVFRVEAIPDVYTILLILLGAVAFCSMGVFLGGLVKDVEAATALGYAIAFPMMFLSGSFWPLEIMPEYMQQIAQTLPLYYFSQGLRQTLILQAPATALASYIILAALMVVFVFAATLTTKWKDF